MFNNFCVCDYQVMKSYQIFIYQFFHYFLFPVDSGGLTATPAGHDLEVDLAQQPHQGRYVAGCVAAATAGIVLPTAPRPHGRYWGDWWKQCGTAGKGLTAEERIC